MQRDSGAQAALEGGACAGYNGAMSLRTLVGLTITLIPSREKLAP